MSHRNIAENEKADAAERETKRIRKTHLVRAVKEKYPEVFALLVLEGVLTP